MSLKDLKESLCRPGRGGRMELSMKKIAAVSLLTALLFSLSCFTAFGYSERQRSIPSVRITIQTGEIEIGDELSDDADSYVTVPDNQYYTLDDAEWLDDIRSVKVGDEPRMKVYLSNSGYTIEHSDYDTVYSFRGSYNSSNVRVTNGEFISAAKRDGNETLEVTLDRVAPNQGSFKTQFYGREKKMELKSQEDVDQVLSAIRTAPFSVSKIKRQDKNRAPAPPFITSTLQQEASRKLNMTPRRTMSIAQQLYEGVDIEGEGTVGLITYMRTDSLRLSDEAVAAARAFAGARYGQAYLPDAPRQFKAKAGAQDAHEAIRPSNVDLTPESVRKSLTLEQYRLYKLIWSRFLACQMASAVYDSVNIEVTSAGYTFRASRSEVKFPGFLAVYEEGKDEEGGEIQTRLPNLQEGEPLTLGETKPEQKFTQPPTRYTEATLIRALEEKGIGRPSTYAPTISTIMAREYVVKDGKYLHTTPLGEVVTTLMKDKFHDIVDYAFTADMESRLDKVESGEENWKKVLGDFYQDFHQELVQAEQDLDGTRIKVPDEVSDEVCDVCGRQLVVKSGRFGRFLACPGFPECTFTKPIVIQMPGKCPKCGGRILKKTSRNGYTYYGCEYNGDKLGRACDFMTWDVPVKETCPECGWTLFKKSGRGFKKPFCINPECPAFVPEEKRGGFRKKKTEAADTVPTEQGTEAAQETAPKKIAVKAEKKPAAKKTAAAKKPAAKKTTAKKTAVKKTTTQKTAAKKAAEPTQEEHHD